MKNLLTLALVALLCSCATDQYLLSSSEMETSPYHTEGYNIMKGEVVIGKVTSTEIEIDPKGNVVKEISVTLTDLAKAGEAEEVMKFLHTKYPNKKIEVNLDRVDPFK